MRCFSLPDHLRQGVEDKLYGDRSRDPTANSTARKDVNHEGHIDLSRPGGRICEVGHPELVTVDLI
jgi:hypothetical protein